LLEKDDAPTEGDFAVHKDAELQCTRTGQVLEDFKGLSVFDLNARRETELAKARKPLERELLRKHVWRLLGLPVSVGKGRPTSRNLVLETEPGLEVVFATVAEAKKAGLATAVRLSTGETEYLLQLRGLGTEAVRPNLSGDKEAFLSLHLARPLLGQRVLDLLSAVEYLGQDVHLIASGPAGVAALHAAALDPRIKSVTIEGSLVSWSSVVHTPISRGPTALADAVPGVLAWYDLPDLAALIAPRPLTIRKPIDAAGNPVGQPELERVYAACRKAYAAGKKETDLSLEAAPPR
jgi:hypothetical protein